MNTAITNTQNGSESSNAIAESGKKNTKIHELRLAYAGAKFEEMLCDDSLGVLVLVQTISPEKVVLLAFSGRRVKRDFYYSFVSMERAAQYQAEWYQKLVDERDKKAAAKAAPHGLAVGDVLVSSWGYDQTNIDYYEVTRLVGLRSVAVQEIAQQRTYNAHEMTGQCVPIKGRYVGEEMVKRVTECNAVKVQSWGVWARKKESVKVAGVDIFKPDRYSSYA